MRSKTLCPERDESCRPLHMPLGGYSVSANGARNGSAGSKNNAGLHSSIRGSRTAGSGKGGFGTAETAASAADRHAEEAVAFDVDEIEGRK